MSIINTIRSKIGGTKLATPVAFGINLDMLAAYRPSMANTAKTVIYMAGCPSYKTVDMPFAEFDGKVKSLVGDVVETTRSKIGGRKLSTPLSFVIMLHNLGAYRQSYKNAGKSVVYLAGSETYKTVNSSYDVLHGQVQRLLNAIA